MSSYVYGDRFYISNFFGLPIQETENDSHARACLEAMIKYGDNRWWRSQDYELRAYYQLKEPVLLIPYHEFHAGLENLLGRVVSHMEIHWNTNRLIAEAEEVYKKKYSGR